MLVIKNLQLPADLSRRIEREGESAYPNECCGLLIGMDSSDARRVTHIRPAENAYPPGERLNRFSIEPRVLMSTDREAADQGQSVLGFYHSHPDHPARPSEFDRENAWPFYSYVIVSIANGRTLDMTSWVLDEETRLFQRQEIEEI